MKLDLLYNVLDAEVICLTAAHDSWASNPCTYMCPSKALQGFCLCNLAVAGLSPASPSLWGWSGHQKSARCHKSKRKKREPYDMSITTWVLFPPRQYCTMLELYMFISPMRSCDPMKHAYLLRRVGHCLQAAKQGITNIYKHCFIASGHMTAFSESIRNHKPNRTMRRM